MSMRSYNISNEDRKSVIPWLKAMIYYLENVEPAYEDEDAELSVFNLGPYNFAQLLIGLGYKEAADLEEENLGSEKSHYQYFKKENHKTLLLFTNYCTGYVSLSLAEEE